MEFLDIIDPITGLKTGEIRERKEVHSLGLWHVGIHLWIINSKGELLIQKRSSNKELYPSMLYVSVAGHPISGETDIETIKRETFEEIGINVEESNIQHLYNFSQKVSKLDGKYLDNQFYHVYLLEMDLDLSTLLLQEEEVAKVKNIHFAKFERMVNSNSKEIVPHPEGYKKLFEILHARYD